MYHSEAEANVHGFSLAPRSYARKARAIHQAAYPVACRIQFKVALAVSILAHIAARHA